MFEPKSFLLLFFELEKHDRESAVHWEPIDLTHLPHGRVEREPGAVLSPGFKFLIRKGVPLPLARKVILDLFKKTYAQNEEDYRAALQANF
jgi:hypothetical protein